MINAQTITADFLKTNENIDELFEFIIPYNIFKSKELIEQPFQNVMDIIKLLQAGDLLKAVCLSSGLIEYEILKTSCNDFMQHVKWLVEQTKLINNLMQSLSVDDFDEDSIMLQSAGVESLNKYEEIMIYYNIDKNPTTWEKLGKVPFSIMFTKLSIDKDTAKIQKNYHNLLKNKNKS